VLKKIAHVVGARPNFMKCAPVIHALSRVTSVELQQVLIHTGQHYDEVLSGSFMKTLGMPIPDINLNSGAEKSPSLQIAKIIQELDSYFSSNHIDLLLVYGDINSTVAAALAANKRGIKVAHIESGLRSFDKSMPEEVNRAIVDRISDIHFVTEISGVRNLANEGYDEGGVFFVGNTMIDSLFKFAKDIFEEKEDCILMTFHRPSNVDNLQNARNILNICHSIRERIYFPIHPRTRKNFERFSLLTEFEKIENLVLLEPVGYTDFIRLMKKSKIVITDSGGIQEETTALKIPCITVRKNTERPSTITSGTNTLVQRFDLVLKTIESINKNAKKGADYDLPLLWDGQASFRIASKIEEILREKRL